MITLNSIFGRECWKRGTPSLDVLGMVKVEVP